MFIYDLNIYYFLLLLCLCIIIRYFLLSYYVFCKVVISPYVIMYRDILLATYSGTQQRQITSDQNKITKLK